MTDKILPHPLAELFPLLDDAALHEMATDIAENGLREPVVLFEGQILDGRNRYRAARIAEAECRFTLFDPAVDGDPLKWVLSKNLHRRHLNESQRAMVASRLAKLRVGRPSEWNVRDEKSSNLSNLSTVKQDDAADMLHVSRGSVQTARRVQENAAPEVIAAVDRGEVAVSAAADLAELPEAKQLEILRTVPPRLIGKVAKEHREIGQGGKKDKRAAREAELAARQQALPEKRFGVIYADPEWRFEPYSRESGMDRAADNHYPTSTLDDILARPVASIAADDAVLFLWSTVPMLPQALAVLTAWGFDYKSHTIWRKAAPAACGHFEHPGKLVLGMGYWFRNGHELLLVGTRGNVPAPAMGDQWPSVIDAEPLRHSQKPERFYELIESYFPSLPKIELNARAARAGWERWGNESPEASGTAREAPGSSAPESQKADGIAGLSEDRGISSAGGLLAQSAADQVEQDGTQSAPQLHSLQPDEPVDPAGAAPLSSPWEVPFPSENNDEATHGADDRVVGEVAGVVSRASEGAGALAPVAAEGPEDEPSAGEAAAPSVSPASSSPRSGQEADRSGALTSAEQNAIIRDGVAAGRLAADLAQATGLNVETVYKRIQRMKLADPSGKRRREALAESNRRRAKPKEAAE